MSQSRADSMERPHTPPGTVLLGNRASEGLNELNGVEQDIDGHVILQPRPTNDPNQPLNWPTYQKALIFGIANIFTLMVYTTLDVGTVTWTSLQEEFGFSNMYLSASYASGLAGMGVGCFFLIPVAISFGRKPLYAFASLVMVLVNVGQAMFQTKAQWIILQVLAGLAGSINDTIVQMTIVDLFFVHQRATMNGIYSIMVVMGTYLSLIPTGYIIQSQGWRWVWWWCAILNGAVLTTIIFVFEETRYAHPAGDCFEGQEMPVSVTPNEDKKALDVDADKKHEAAHPLSTSDATVSRPASRGQPPQRRNYLQRVTFMGPPPDTSIKHYWEHMWRPFLLFFRIPAVAFVAIQYSFILCWVAILATTQPILYAAPPYNFSSIGVGNVNIAPFVGAVVGSFYGGPLNDLYVVHMARRRGGVYDPELRLHMLLVPLVITPLGLFLYGISIAKSLPWIVPVVGSGFVGFGIGSVTSIIFPYVGDCYRELVAEALVVVTYVRNGLATAAAFAVSPWLSGLGPQNMFIIVGCLCFAILLLTIPMVIWGRTARAYTAGFYMDIVASR